MIQPKGVLRIRSIWGKATAFKAEKNIKDPVNQESEGA